MLDVDLNGLANLGGLAAPARTGTVLLERHARHAGTLEDVVDGRHGNIHLVVALQAQADADGPMLPLVPNLQHECHDVRRVANGCLTRRGKR